MILFLDDDPHRAALAYQRMSETDRTETIWCQTAEEAIVTLNDYKSVLKKVMLDHDLGGEQYVNIKREDCGMEVVRWLERNSQNDKEFQPFTEIEFIIHSHNPYAGPKMAERLQKLGLNTKLQPFGT
jgi:hypothetical protein